MDRTQADFTASFAEIYDRYSVPMDFALRCPALRARECHRARSVLETAAGTGVVTRELACILLDNVSITGTDLNEPTIALAQSNLGSGRSGGRPMHVTCLLEILSSTLWCAKQRWSFVTAPGAARILTRAAQLVLKKLPMPLLRRSDPGSGPGRSREPLKG